MAFRGLDVASPLNRLKASFASMLSNVRTYLTDTLLRRNVLSNPVVTTGTASVVSIIRLNDSTPSGPVSGYAIISADSAGNLWCNFTRIATGLSGNPVSMVVFRPNTSSQPWVYIFDSSTAITISTINILTGASVDFTCSGSVKVNANGRIYKTGTMEPQYAPIVGINTTSVSEYLSLPATTPPWTNIGGVNADQNYGGTDIQPPYAAIIPTPVAGSTVALTVTGTAHINGATHAPGDLGSTSPDFPGDFIASAKIVVFAFTDANGNILAQSTVGGAPPVLGNVGASATLTVPAGATQLQIGINSMGGTFAANSGSYLIQAIVSTNAIVEVTSIVGLIAASVFGDSPHSGPVAEYIWCNPDDSGTGIPRTIGEASVSVTNNSLIFDSTPEDGTVPVQWSTLDSTGATVGSIPLFSPALESAGYQDFNCCITGALFFPAAGTYTIQIQNKDQVMFGMGGGATSTGGAVYGSQGQSMTVANGLPLLYVSTPNGEGGAVTQSFPVTVPGQGIYQFEFDWDYWDHTGRSFICEISPTPGTAVATVPPLPQGTRTGVVYFGKPRSSLTGAAGNPSPGSPIQETPVLANTISGAFVNDPQADKMDYYRQDDGLPDPTYVGTGPNDGLLTINGVIYNTAITDTLSDLAAADNPGMDEDDFEPVPSIDTPKSGMVTIVGGIVTWKSGDKFNVRWLAGTVVLIGQATTQTAFSLNQRPLSTTQMVIPDVGDTIGDAAGDGVPYNISEPILANQPTPYVYGPTDNINFAFANGDKNRGGTSYWSKGNNLDSWPDTNQDDVTDPGETLINGAMSSGVAVQFSTTRAWVVEANNQNAQATSEGTIGTQWIWQTTAIDRGLYMPRCLYVQGGGLVLYRVFDGIQVSSRGSAGKSITDQSLYPLFPHEGSIPQPIVRNGITIYPPDDTKPQGQQFRGAGQFMYWDMIATNGQPQTLTFDIQNMAWLPDATVPPVTTHADDVGLSSSGVLAGCSDGTIRELVSSGGAEAPTATVATGAIGGQGWCHFAEMTVEYLSNSIATVLPVVIDTDNGSYYSGPAVTLPSTGGKMQKQVLYPFAGKWKLIQFVFSWTDPTFQLYTPGFAVSVAAWGGEYQNVNPFAGEGGFGGQV